MIAQKKTKLPTIHHTIALMRKRPKSYPCTIFCLLFRNLGLSLGSFHQRLGSSSDLYRVWKTPVFIFSLKSKNVRIYSSCISFHRNPENPSNLYSLLFIKYPQRPPNVNLHRDQTGHTHTTEADTLLN